LQGNLADQEGCERVLGFTPGLRIA
jgi:hypothetical protein